uniref:Deoxyribonuclease 1 like 2 n=1 Tax=Chelonoidis abingdonii TaxID=106734 RepID=A0A8C0IVN1_CHEAB
MAWPFLWWALAELLVGSPGLQVRIEGCWQNCGWGAQAGTVGGCGSGLRGTGTAVGGEPRAGTVGGCGLGLRGGKPLPSQTLCHEQPEPPSHPLTDSLPSLLFPPRTQTVSVVATYQYPDPNNTFSREPFIVKFSSPKSSKHKGQEFVLVPLHTPPSEAVAEIDALYDVYLDVIDKWGTDNIMFLGDFNADCSYVKKGDWGSIRLHTSEVFEWLIPDSADTTVGKSDCAYDRIVVCGSKLKKSIKPKSAAVYDFQQAFKLEEAEALAVSDHFPVEVTLKAH